MSRWISCVRPETFPRTDSRGIRSFDERGSMPYSAVTQPFPLPFEPMGNALFEGRGADHFRVSDLDEHRAFGVAQVAAG